MQNRRSKNLQRKTRRGLGKSIHGCMELGLDCRRKLHCKQELDCRLELSLRSKRRMFCRQKHLRHMLEPGSHRKQLKSKKMLCKMERE